MYRPGIDSETVGVGLEACWDCVSSLLMRNDKRLRVGIVFASLITALVCCDCQNTQSQRNNTQVTSQSITIYMHCVSVQHTHTHTHTPHTHTHTLLENMFFSPLHFTYNFNLAEDEKCGKSLKRILVIHMLVCRYG